MADWLAVEEVELVKVAITSADSFEGLADTICKDDEPPSALINAIESCVRLFFGTGAKLTKQGSVPKGTSNLVSDFDYHIETPTPHAVTKSQMREFGEALKSLPGQP